MSEAEARDIQTVLAFFVGTPLSLPGLGYITEADARAAAKRLAQASEAVLSGGLTGDEMETCWPGLTLALGYGEV